MRLRPIVGPMFALMLVIAGCGSGSGSSPSHERPASIQVISSISSGASLSAAVPWTVTTHGAAQVKSVAFLVDGRVLWTEHKPPYVFNDDGNVLEPWLLPAGKHSLAVRVETTTGRRVGTASQVTVMGHQSLPKALTGSFRRTVSAADIRRTQPHRSEPPDQALPVGSWTLHIDARGLIRFDDPHGSGGAEAVTTPAPGTLTLFGPPNWLVPADRQGSFCDAEQPSTYQWSVHGRTLTIRSGHDPNCADRDALFTGRWTRIG